MSELARSVAAQRRALKTEEQLLRQREAALDVAGLQGFVKAKEEAERLHAQAQALVARRAGALHRAEKLQAERHRRAPISSPASPLYLHCISPISPSYLPYTSPVSPLYLP